MFKKVKKRHTLPSGKSTRLRLYFVPNTINYKFKRILIPAGIYVIIYIDWAPPIIGVNKITKFVRINNLFEDSAWLKQSLKYLKRKQENPTFKVLIEESKRSGGERIACTDEIITDYMYSIKNTDKFMNLVCFDHEETELNFVIFKTWISENFTKKYKINVKQH